MNLKKKVGLGGVDPSDHCTSTDTPCLEAERLPLPVSLPKQPIQILYYITQPQMTSNM